MVELTPEIVGAVVSITRALEAAKFVAMAKLDIVLPTPSVSAEPELKAILSAVRSDDVSPACTV